MSNDDDNNELTAEEQAGAAKIALIAMIVGFLATAGIWANNNLRDCMNDDFCVGVNQEFKLTSVGMYESINGLAAVQSANAEIELASGEIVPVGVSAYANDNWNNGIEIDGLSVNGISVTDYMDPIRVRLAYHIPDLSGSVGETAILRLSARVIMPVLDAADSVANRTFGGNMSYSDVAEDFNDETEIRLQPQGFEDPGRIGGIWFWLSLIVGVLAMFSTIGLRMDDDEEEEEEAAVEA